MINNQIKEGNNKESTTDKTQVSAPSISLPKGGGAIRGIDEKFSANPVTGTGSLSVPIFTTPSRSDFYPKLSLSYDSGAGNGPFGLGWDLSIPSITRKTEKGLPRYWDAEDSDTFILSGAEDLVPALEQKDDSTWGKVIFPKTVDSEVYTVQRYRPRIEGLFARIEKWTNKQTGDVHWESITKDNIKSIYGKSTKDTKGKISDPDSDPDDNSRVFKWLLEESSDDKGNIIFYEYKQENADNVNQSWPQEKNRLANGAGFANRYLKRIKYGNNTPFQRDEWLFQLVFDYGEHDLEKPEVAELQSWPVRPDAFSSYKSTFEIRTYRLCQRVLMFHSFSELGNSPCLVRSTDFEYNDKDTTQGPVACYLTSVTQTGYIRENGTGDYQKKSFPPLEFAYSERTINEEIHFSDAESLENLPVGLDGAQYEWVDLNSEGISGILTEQADGWFYKRNLGNAQFTPDQVVPLTPPPPLMTLPPPPSLTSLGDARFAPVQVVIRKPSIANLQGGQQQLMDLAGDGQLDLVQFSGPLPGYYERDDDGEWEPFTPFSFNPNIAWNDPNLRFIDLNGDGHTDILISEDEVFVWYPSRAEEGFGPAEFVRKPFDEEKGPVMVFADAAQSIYLADMSGDGLTDIVRITNGEVCYWPNLGYGRFGAKVTMDAAPYFDYPEYFNQKRIRLADIDGSGTTDIIYLGRDTITFWFNQAGNSWSETHRLSNFPATDNLSSVTVIDLLGNGTACIVWSSPLPAANGHPMQYIDLMGGVKPHLLQSTKNNMGAETIVQYTSSTKFYLEDLAAGTPWITRLPFPVHVLERVEVRDEVGDTKLVTLHKYHHGYYDGTEREFRGFGLVEQWDTEFFSQFKDTGLINGDIANANEEFHLPPVYTKSWFHNGAFLDRDNISQHYAQEYYSGDSKATLLPDTTLPPGLTSKEEQEACRALKGRILRQEVYAEDNSLNSLHPYSATEHTYHLRLIQPMQSNPHAVFYAYDFEALAYHYERNPTDPRISHTMTLEVDDFGNVTKAVSVAYPRRNPQFAEQGEISGQSGKGNPLITYTENRVTNKPNEPDWYRIGVPIESRTYEITGLEVTGLPFFVPYTTDFIQEKLQTATEISYEVSADPSTPQKRLIEYVRTLYYKDDLSGPLLWDEVESHALTHALSYESYKLAFTPGLLTEVYGSRVNDDLLKDKGKYIKSADYKAQGLFPIQDNSDYWWIPSGRQIFDPTKFYLPVKFIDPFIETLGLAYVTTYDNYSLLVEETKDPLENVVQAKNNYRTMLPWHLTDPNGNRAAVRFDALGMVVATAVMGKAGQNEGNTFDETTIETSNSDDPTTRLEYDLFDWIQNGTPNFVHTFAREQHGPSNPRWQESYSYSDGFGREIQKKIQAEPGLVEGTFVSERWVGTGWTIFNNKGKPIKKYEPFFDNTHEFKPKKVGVSSTLFYDPVERVVATLHPNYTYEKVVFDPWQQKAYDVNDTVTFNPETDEDVKAFFTPLPDADYLPTWYDQRINGGNGVAEQAAAIKAEAHAGTPTVVHLDTLGRTFLTIADNGTAGKYETRVELDIEGNQRSVTDALGRKVMTYDYDMLGTRIHQISMDAGERWMLNDVAGKPIRGWDSRGYEIRTTYDELQRPTSLFVRQGNGNEVMAERTGYGETHPDAVLLNLLGKPFQHFDGAGVVTNNQYDFKGNLLSSTRQLLQNYKDQVDWSLSPALESETFTSSTIYDALNRPITLTTPDSSVIRPTYNEANLLEKVDVNLRGAPTATQFVIDIDYNAKGQRELIEYGNGVTTTYEYDDETFRLIHLLTTRKKGTEFLQDLKYTFDPVGNITQIRDDAQQTIFFNNAQVTPVMQYTYDPIYRLIHANGREHIGQTSNNLPEHRPELKPHYDFNDSTRMNLFHPNNVQAMRNYTEDYEYDEVGNILSMIHQANDGSWTRRYEYASDSSRLLSTSLPGDGDPAPYSAKYEYDEHGNIIEMPHLSLMQWDFKDQLQATSKQVVNNGGTPEITYYVYDAAGQRVRKVTEGQAEAGQTPTRMKERIYLGGFEIYREYNGDGSTVTLERETLHIMDDRGRIALVETKTHDEGVVVPSPTPVIRYQLENYLRSASLELDAVGEIVSYEEYYPYGSTSYQAGPNVAEVSLKRYRYTGKERDEETGLYYHGARYYAPWLGRWTAADPAGITDGLNVYRYVSDNPIRLSDSLGTSGSEPNMTSDDPALNLCSSESKCEPPPQAGFSHWSKEYNEEQAQGAAASKELWETTIKPQLESGKGISPPPDDWAEELRQQYTVMSETDRKEFAEQEWAKWRGPNVSKPMPEGWDPVQARIDRWGFNEAHNSAVLQGGDLASGASLVKGLAGKLAFHLEGELVSRGLFSGRYEVGSAGGFQWGAPLSTEGSYRSVLVATKSAEEYQAIRGATSGKPQVIGEGFVPGESPRLGWSHTQSTHNPLTQEALNAVANPSKFHGNCAEIHLLDQTLNAGGDARLMAIDTRYVLSRGRFFPAAPCPTCADVLSQLGVSTSVTSVQSVAPWWQQYAAGSF